MIYDQLQTIILLLVALNVQGLIALIVKIYQVLIKERFK